MSTVLVVDDAQTDRELLARVAASAGHRVITASDGKEAVDLAKSQRPDVIFLDVVMPNQDGFATCRTLKKDPATQSIPIVLVTSKGTESDKFWGRKQGADEHVVKPWSEEAIHTVLRRYCR